MWFRHDLVQLPPARQRAREDERRHQGHRSHRCGASGGDTATAVTDTARMNTQPALLMPTAQSASSGVEHTSELCAVLTAAALIPTGDERIVYGQQHVGARLREFLHRVQSNAGTRAATTGVVPVRNVVRLHLRRVPMARPLLGG
ncbi:hypothetical protein ASD51_33485 [Streptomyces sp. Root55]|nr:hypothetical protein ASD51_33485 [Streptomyces sp. Root55]